MFQKYKYHSLILLAGLSYSFLAVFTAALSQQGINSFNQVFWRLLLAAILVFLTGKFLFKQKISINLKKYRYVVVNSFLFLFGFSTFAGSIYLGTPIAKAIALNYAYPITVIFLAYLLFGDKPSFKNIIAVIISMISVGLLLEVWNIQSVGEIRMGDILAWLNSFFYGGIIVWGSKTRKDTGIDTFSLLFYTLITAIPGILALGLIFEIFKIPLFNYPLFFNFLPTTWINLLGLALMGTVLPYVLMYFSAPKLKSLTTSILLLSEPIFVYIFGVLFFNQQLSWWGILGLLGIMISVVLV